VYQLFGKRLMDVLIALCAIICLLPVLLMLAISIKLFDPGVIFFVQKRVGKDGKEFSFYKFRSMPMNTGDISSDKIGELKLTKIGKLLRRTNLDELPQLFNILKGDMSIVGPRPPIVNQTELIKLRKNNGALALLPGLTGLAQINSYDGMTVLSKAEFDGEYSKNISIFQDIKIILGTFLYLLKPPPVY